MQINHLNSLLPIRKRGNDLVTNLNKLSQNRLETPSDTVQMYSFSGYLQIFKQKNC